MNRKIFSTIVIFTGTVVGAGIFGIPYVIAKVGFILGLIYLMLLGVVVTIILLAYGEVILRTKKFHQATGYAEKYLGKWGKLLMSFSLVAGIYGALLAYMIGVGDFLYTVLHGLFGGSPILYSAIFFAIASMAIMFGLGMILKIEKGMFILLFIVAIFIFVIGINKVDLNNLASLHLENIFLPFGVILFAFTGISAIPDMSRVLGEDKKLLKKSIVLGMFIVFVIYLLFTFIIVGVSGQNTSQEAIIGLKDILGAKIILIGAIFGILAMTTSFLTLGLALKEMYSQDYGLDKTLAWVLTCFVPFILFILGLSSFVEVLGIVGSITGGFSSILILAMYRRAKKRGDQEPEYLIKIPNFVIYILYIIFGLAVLYQVYYIFFQ